MRRQDVAADRRRYLVPALGHPQVCALVAPPTPRRLVLQRSQEHGFAEAHAALGRLQGTLERLSNVDMVTRTLARREAVASSRIEGTRSNLSQLLTYEATQGATGLPPDVRVTERYVMALQHGLDRVRADGRRGLTLSLLDELHSILMQDDDPGHPKGTYRADQAWIGTSTRIEDAIFVPAPPAYIAGCMNEMAEAILQYRPREDEQASPSLLTQMAIAHAQFETIHPYHDGNGRTGRLLLPLLLAAEGLPPLYLSGSLLRARTEYYAALAAVQLRGDWGPWLELLARAVIEACKDSVEIAVDLVALAERWEFRLQRYRSDSAIRRLPRLLIGHPVLSVQQAARELGVSVAAANGALNNLLKTGIVELVDERQWGRLFRATEVLARLDREPGNFAYPA